MPSTIVGVISAVILLVVLAIAVPLRNKIREDQAAERQREAEEQKELDVLRREWEEEDALLDLEEDEENEEE